MSIKIQYKGINLVVHNTDTRFGFGGNIEPNSVFKVESGKDRFWDISAFTLVELQEKFEKLVDEKMKEVEEKKKNAKDILKIDYSLEYYYEGFLLQLKITSGFKIYIAECKEIGFSMTTSSDTDHIKEEFKKAVDTKLKDDKKKDEDLFLVETFIEKLTLIKKEMQLLRDNPHKNLVLDVKLGKLYEKAKDVFHLSSYDSFKIFYIMKFPDK